MSSTLLRLRQPPALRVDLRGVSPAVLAGLALYEIERLAVTHGNQTLPLAEFFDISQQDSAADELRFEGDLSRFDRIGWQSGSGRVVVDGPAGDYTGACMTGGELLVLGNVGLLAACEMAGGTLGVHGDVGDFAASPLPGSMDGMRGGSFIVHGNAGARFGDRMRRGTALVFGDVGDFVASRMVAGTIGIGGQAGTHVAYGMRRGSVVFAGTLPALPPTFVPAVAGAEVIWQLLARDLARHGGPFSALTTRRIERHLGDVAAAGKGELILAG
jgi:formylmethanofuran dehydrogenase subunit C